MCIPQESARRLSDLLIRQRGGLSPRPEVCKTQDGVSPIRNRRQGPHSKRAKNLIIDQLAARFLKQFSPESLDVVFAWLQRSSHNSPTDLLPNDQPAGVIKWRHGDVTHEFIGGLFCSNTAATGPHDQVC